MSSKSPSSEKNRTWGGRFSGPTNAFVQEFTASYRFDFRMAKEDLRGSRAHCRMLAKQGILTEAEAKTILEGLDQVEGKLEAGEIELDPALEDVHMHVEATLKQLIGPVAGKLHTARSRNDQVATDLRLYLREEINQLRERLRFLQTGLLDLAEAHVDVVLPGFTHLQIAQPISFAHHLLAYFEMFERDHQRLGETQARVNHLPLGAAALAGTTFPIDRHMVAEELGFAAVMENSLDAVSDRDFALEFLSDAAICMAHLSRFSEELVLWCSPGFGFVELPDAFCTGSSIMPQKKNPDVPELIRGKTGRVNGALVSLLTLMKSLPLAYNKDMQEDKEPVFDALDTLHGCLRAMGELVPGIQPRRDRMAAQARDGYSTATDLADYLVRKDLPFREAHEVVGTLVRMAIEKKIELPELSLEAMQGVDSRIQADVFEVLTVEGSVSARRAFGGTAFASVREALGRARGRISDS